MKLNLFVCALAILIAIFAAVATAQTVKRIGNYDIYYDAGLTCLSARGKVDCNRAAPCRWIDFGGFCSYDVPGAKHAACVFHRYEGARRITIGRDGDWLCENAANFGIV